MSLIPPLEIARFPPSNVLHTQLQLHHQILYRQHNITHHHNHHHHHHNNHPEEITNTGWLLPPTPGSGPTLPGDVTVSLKNDKLWQQFHAETTEMIITKLGRRMFPSLQLQIEGLERRSRYCLLLEIAPASRRRHKYVGSSGVGDNQVGPSSVSSRGWTSAGPAEPQPHVNRRVYLHPDSPATGSHWMQHPVSFNKLKLTNNAVDPHSNVVLTSMHKYVPRIWIVRCDDISRLTSLFSQPASSFCFSETEFIAVTAYQNENITKLKIDNNPFAKGFRETGQSRCKRKMQNFDTSAGGDELAMEDRDGVAYCTTERLQDDESNISSSADSSDLQNNCSRRLQQSEDDSLNSSLHHHHHHHHHHRHRHNQRAKRAASETGSLDDSGVSSTGSASPPLLTSTKKEEGVTVAQPRLHRPWADNDDDDEQDNGNGVEKSGLSINDDKNNFGIIDANTTTAMTTTTTTNHHQHHQHQIRHISSIDFARIQQIQQIQHYQQLQYQQYCQINQIKNQLAIHFPLSHYQQQQQQPHHHHHHQHFQTFNSIRSKYLFDFNIPTINSLSPADSSTAISTDESSAISS